MFRYIVMPNYVAARNIGSDDPQEQAILDVITFLSKFHRYFTTETLRHFIKKRHDIDMSEEDICIYLSLYVTIGILRVI